MLTQKSLAQLIADLWAVSAQMNAASSTSELVSLDGIEFAPVQPEWLQKAAESLQKAAEDLESLMDDETPIPMPPVVIAPVLTVVKEADETQSDKEIEGDDEIKSEIPDTTA